MKLQLKRKPKQVVMSNWHPNFCNSDLLPDLKVVRTSFFLNVICVTAATAALLFIASREYAAVSIRGDIKLAERRIEETSKTNKHYLTLNSEFAEASRKFTEAGIFLDSPIKASETLISLSTSLPETMEFTTIVLDGSMMTLRGTIRGLSETASTRLTAYLGVLREDPVLGPRFAEVSLTSLQREPNSQGLSFEIQLIKGPDKA